MKAVSWRTLLCAFSLSTMAAHGAAPSVDELAALIDHRVATLSMDGKRIAYTGRAGGRRALMVLDLEKRTNKAILAAEEDSFDIRWCQFKSDTRILCGLTGTVDEGKPYNMTRLIAINADGSKFKLLIQRAGNKDAQFQADITDWRLSDPKHIYVELSPEGSNSPFPNVYELDVEGGNKRMIQKQLYPIRGWRADKHGVLRYGSGCDDHGRCEYVSRAKAGDPWQNLKSWEAFQNDDDFSVLGFGPGGDTLLVTGVHEGRTAVYQADLTGKAGRELVFAHPKVDVGGVLRWPLGGDIAGFWYETERTRREFFDAEAKSVYELIDKSLPGSDNTIVDMARDNKLLFIVAHRDTSPATYYLLDLEKKSLAKVGALTPEIATDTFGEMKPVQIKIEDGVVIPGYLSLPPGKAPEKLPMVVYPHGGPHSRDTWGFDPMVQLMVSRGYAVLQMNFRGSVGYGNAWYESGLRKWGSVMVSDINASTQWAVDQGYADPKRICIVGWSFGGYAALMASIREPWRYRCVGSIAGVADLRTLRREEWRFYGGAQAADAIIGTESEELDFGSPLKLADRIQAPVLLVHGESDVSVDVDHSKRMARAVPSNKLDELVLIDDGDHSLIRSAWRKTLYEKLDAFLAKNLR
jgi:dipeptidyl aminopeptidase/acylaminoacyl peptidase